MWAQHSSLNSFLYEASKELQIKFFCKIITKFKVQISRHEITMKTNQKIMESGKNIFSIKSHCCFVVFACGQPSVTHREHRPRDSAVAHRVAGKNSSFSVRTEPLVPAPCKVQTVPESPLVCFFKRLIYQGFISTLPNFIHICTFQKVLFPLTSRPWGLMSTQD